MNRYLGAVVIVGIVFGAFIMAGGLSKAIDAMSFIFVAGIGVGHALGAKSGESAITRFGAKTLGFEHPLTKKALTFNSDLPEDFTACLEKWRAYVGVIE